MAKPLSYPKEKIRVLLLEGVHARAVEHFRQAGYENVESLDHALGGEALKDAIADAHLIGVRSRTQLTADALAGARRLIGIGCFCIGTNQVELASAARQGVPVFNAPHSNTRSVAELVLCEMVMLLRGLGDKNTAAHAGRWTKTAQNSHELRGKTLGVVGYGHIGSQVSILAEAFGMRVLFHDVVPKLPMGNAQQQPGLGELLAQVDVVSLHVPEAVDTQLLMGADQIRAMKPGAYLINASRGSVVDVDALAAALRDGHLRGAALDVFPTEPRSKDEPFESVLRGLPNVILTPHIGGSTGEAQENIGIEVASKLVAYSDQGTTIGAVNFPAISLARQPGPSHRLLHIHRNQPGVLGALNKALADAEANILGQHLQTTGEVGFVVTDVHTEYLPELQAMLDAIPGTIRSRTLY